MNRWRRTTVIASLLSIALVAGTGCGDVKVDGPDGGQEDAAPQQDAGATLILRVLVGPNTAAQTPGAGATVALQGSYGVIGEKTADTQGRVTFTGIEFDKGAVSATAYLGGYPLYSRMGITETTDEVPLWIQVPVHHGKELVEISGARIRDPAVPGLGETTSFEGLWNTWFEDTTSTWTLDTWNSLVPKGEPFSVVAWSFTPGTAAQRETLWEQMEWIAVDHDAVDQPTTIDLDFSQPLTAKSVQGNFVPVLRADSPALLAGYPTIGVGSWRNGYSGPWVGIQDHVWFDSVGATRVNYSVQWVELPDFVEPTTVFGIDVPPCWGYVSIMVPGYPKAGTQTGMAFLDQPLLLSPVDPDVLHPLHSPIEFHLYDANVAVFLRVWRQGAIVWSVEIPETETTFTMPRLPSTVDSAAVLGTDALQAKLTTSERDELGLERRAALSCPFKLDPTTP